jgi:hypothetical protein
MGSILAPVSAAAYRNGHQNWYGAVEFDAGTGDPVWRFDSVAAGFDTAEIYQVGGTLKHRGFDPSSVQRLDDGRTLIADWDQGVIVDEDGDVHRTFTHDLMNDVHEIQRTDDGTYLVASTGMDTLVLLDEEFDELWRWHMWEHVDPTTRPGDYYPNRVWFRNPKHTPYNPDDRYHLNYATVLDGTLSGSGGPQLLCSALNYGVFVVDFETDEVVREYTGLDECHNPYELADGLLVPESGRDRVVHVDWDDHRETVFEGGMDFVKDADPAGGDEWVLADTKNSRVLLWERGEQEPREEFFLGTESFPYEADYLA